MDPYLLDGVDGGDVILLIIKAVIAFVICLVATMLMVWFERKVVSRLQNRIGPNVAGPFGLFQTLADGIKLFFKEDIIPTKADRFVFQLAPYLSLIPAFLTFTLIPLGGDFNGDKAGTVTVAGRETFFQVADPPVGILFFLAMSSLGIYGIMLAGWSSGSKYPLLGSVRASAQAISYEAALGLSLAAVILVSGTLSTNGIVSSQAGAGFDPFGLFGRGLIPAWNLIAVGFVPFVVFLLAGTAELNRPPFDLVEAEQELVGGFHTEYSSIRFALFFLAEFMNTVTMGAIIVTLFFGGPAGPAFLGSSLGWLTGFIWFFLKLLVFLFIFVWFRASLPRLRYDQLMDLGWKLLIPVSLAWLLILAAIRIARDGNVGSFEDDAVARHRSRSGHRVLRPHSGCDAAASCASECPPQASGRRRSVCQLQSRCRGRRGQVTPPRRGTSLMGYLEGFGVSFSQIGDTRTREYRAGKKNKKGEISAKDQKRPKPPRTHGRHVLNRYEDGMEKCIGCELCAGVCPANCIYVRGADNPPEDPKSPGERFGFVYEINYLRCIHCDLCVEACPTEAITESKLFEFSFTNRDDAIYTKDELLVDELGKPQQMPWEDWRPGEETNTSGWMRATSPSGKVAYEGKVAWSSELGHGVRPPEAGQSDPEADAPASPREVVVEADSHESGGHH